LLTTKYAIKSPKAAINILKSSPESSKSPKPNFRAPKVRPLSQSWPIIVGWLKKITGSRQLTG